MDKIKMNPNIKSFKWFFEGDKEIQQVIYTVCTQSPKIGRDSKLLYEKFNPVFDRHIATQVLPSLRDKEHDEESMLREVVVRWTQNKVMIKWLSIFFNNLGQHYDVCRYFNIKEIGRERFAKSVLLQGKDKVMQVVTSLINQERIGYSKMDRGLLKEVIGIFFEIEKTKYYDNYFVPFMLKETAAYYSREASCWILQYSCRDYILKAEQCLREEKDRASHYLDPICESKVIDTVSYELLVKYGNKLLKDEGYGILSLLTVTDNEEAEEDLSRVYWLFHKTVIGQQQMQRLFKEQISNEAKDIFQAEEPQDYVRKVTELHEKCTALITHTCLSKDNIFLKVIEESFRELFNESFCGRSGSELLALYFDDILKGGETISSSSEEQVGDGLDLEKVANLVGYIYDKDMFEVLYRNKLSSRLLNDKRCNEHNERRILSAFKKTCGAPFTLKMEGMVTDTMLSKENQSRWKDYLMEKYKEEDGKFGGIDFNATVLTTGFWPTSYKPFDHISLPEEMVKVIEVFKEFYGTITKNRKIRWIYYLGTCVVKVNFESKTIHLNVSTYQAAVLLLFNSADRLSYSEIKSQLSLGDDEDDDLIRILASLSFGKYNILIKQQQQTAAPPNTPETTTTTTTTTGSGEEEYFEFNTRFTHTMPRIKIAMSSPIEGMRMEDATEVINKDRRWAVDASIVRIMKNRKVLSHQKLVMECSEQLKGIFKPEIKLIKQQIEKLIARDFLARDPQNPNTYLYVT